MDNQQPGSECPSDNRDEAWPMESRAEIVYDDILESSDQQSWRHQNAQEDHCCDMLSEIPCLEDIILMEKGQSRGSKGRHDSSFLEMQTRVGEEDGVKGDTDTNGQSKQQKRIRCPEVHNHNERIRRQKLKEKMKALQEIIPNCNRRDKLTTLDDAIKHIKTLQYQVQMMSTGGGYSTFSSPLMMQQPGQQGVRIPYNTLPPFRPQGGNFGGMEYQMGMRMGMEMAGMFPSHPMNQVGVPNPYRLPSSRLPAPGGTHLFEQPNLSSSSSSMDQAPFLQPTQGAVNPSSLDPINDGQFPTSGHLHWSEP